VSLRKLARPHHRRSGANKALLFDCGKSDTRNGAVLLHHSLSFIGDQLHLCFDVRDSVLDVADFVFGEVIHIRVQIVGSNHR
jgi:hypothetical protein